MVFYGFLLFNPGGLLEIIARFGLCLNLRLPTRPSVIAGLMLVGAPFCLGVPVVVAENEVAHVVEGYVRAKEVSCFFVLTLPSGQPGCPKGEAAREKDEEGCDYTYGRCWRRVGGRRSGDHHQILGVE